MCYTFNYKILRTKLLFLFLYTLEQKLNIQNINNKNNYNITKNKLNKFVFAGFSKTVFLILQL